MKLVRKVCVVFAATSFTVWSAETNILSFAYATSPGAEASSPDTWGRKLNDGFWTNSVTDGVRFNGDVTVTVDLGRRILLSGASVYTFTVGGATPLATQGVSLECGNDNATWIPLGALSAQSNGLFSGSAFFANARYLRLSCAKGGGAGGQALAEVVISGSSASVSGSATFTYTASMPYHPEHTDPSLSKLYDGAWTNAGSNSVQYGPHYVADVNPLNPTNCIASNVVISVALGSVRALRSAHLYAFRSNTTGGYGTSRVTLSNSMDGVTWSCAGQQTIYESLPTAVTRFDFILPNVEARYLAFACEKLTNANIVRQLLGEVQLVQVTPGPALGDPLPFTYTFSKAPSVHVDKTECPKLTDGTWASNTRNAIRVYGDVSITADLGVPRYVAGADLLCWSNAFSQEAGTYSTGRVVVFGGLDTNSLTQVAEITSWSPVFPFHHAVTFTNPPYARFLRFDAYRCEDTEAVTNTAQILGELTIYRPPSAVVGALPVAAPGAIPSAGFEVAQIPVGESETMIVKGGVTNGWTFSYANSANYAGFQRNNSPVSTNYPGFSARYFAPEGAQTAVLMGSGSMETQISVPTNGTYTLQFQVNSTVISSTTENGGYDFRVRLDGADKGVVAVLQLTNTMHEVLLPGVAAGTHTLRFEGVNTKNVTWGALIDDLKLKRFEVDAGQISQPGRGFVFVADSLTPLALDYAGSLVVQALWLNGALASPAVYSALSHPAVFEGPGAIRYDRGTLFTVR